MTDRNKFTLIKKIVFKLLKEIKIYVYIHNK